MIHRRLTPTWHVRWSPGYASQTALNGLSGTVKEGELEITPDSYFPSQWNIPSSLQEE